jgi:hypothetical protein
MVRRENSHHDIADQVRDNRRLVDADASADAFSVGSIFQDRPQRANRPCLYLLERFHRTLGTELISRQVIQDLDHAQQCFDLWREVYNFERPHEALDLAVPASRYHESSKSFPETLPPIVYNRNDIVRKVGNNGRIGYRNRLFRVGRGLQGQRVALRPAEKDGILDVYFCDQNVGQIDLRKNGEDL